MSLIEISYFPRGAAHQLGLCQDREVILDGPAGTGKTLALWHKLHALCMLFPGMRALVVRKTLASLKATALETFRRKVLHDGDGVIFRGDSGDKPARYEYPNGSTIAIGGLDKPQKIMSGEYDMIMVNEATDLNIDDLEALTTRLRNGITPYMQLIGDCNPAAPTHWLNQRMIEGRTTRLVSRHEDNPLLYDAQGVITRFGSEYLGRLDALTGVRYRRLRLGQWAAAENAVYEDSFDAARNIIDQFRIPADWPRYLVIDFGYTNPFVCHWLAIDPDGRIYLYREIYMTRRLVEDHAKQIRRLSRWGTDDGEPLPRAVICDHDAEDRATLERHIGLTTTPAHKAVSAGIQAVSARFRPAGDGKPRLLIMRSALVERDALLTEHRLPCSTAEEIDGYVWDTSQNKAKEVPVKKDDHGMDTLRYGVAHFDLAPSDVMYAPRLR